MKELQYIKNGNLTEPLLQDGVNIIIHCCNSGGAMGAGVARALFEKWSLVRSEYVKWHVLTEKGYHEEEEIKGRKVYDYLYFFPDESKRQFALGNVQLIPVEDDLCVGNIIGQYKICNNEIGMPPVRYSAIDYACSMLSGYIVDLDKKVTIHAPYLMGCDLAGGKWSFIEKILIDNFAKNNIECLVYDLFGKYDKY